MIGIIDYGLGNIRAFSNIYKDLNKTETLHLTPRMDKIIKISRKSYLSSYKKEYHKIYNEYTFLDVSGFLCLNDSAL